ncbi:hypothetical protein PYCC9005_001258 [Savitreella phatthalungensis]
MATATRSQVKKLLDAIPIDPLRPHANLRQVLANRQDSFTMRDVSALESLTSNAYKREFPLTDKLLRPAFKPSYYDDVQRAMRGPQTPTSPFHFITKYFRWTSGP